MVSLTFLQCYLCTILVQLDICIEPHKVSDKLYPTSAYIVSSFLLNLAPITFNNLIFALITFAMSGVAFSNFPVFYGWFLLCMLVYGSLYEFAASLGSNFMDALNKVMPISMLFGMFNGFTVSKAAAACSERCLRRDIYLSIHPSIHPFIYLSLSIFAVP